MFFGKLIAAGCTGLLMSLDWKSSSPSPSARHSAGRPFQTLARRTRGVPLRGEPHAHACVNIPESCSFRVRAWNSAKGA